MDSPTSSMFGFRSNPVEDAVAKKKKPMGMALPVEQPQGVHPSMPSLDNAASQGFGQYLSHLAHPNTMSSMNRQTNNGAGTGKSTEAAWRAEFPQAPGSPGWDAAAGMFGPHTQMPASPMALPTPTMPTSPMTTPTPGIELGSHTPAIPPNARFNPGEMFGPQPSGQPIGVPPSAGLPPMGPPAPKPGYSGPLMSQPPGTVPQFPDYSGGLIDKVGGAIGGMFQLQPNMQSGPMGAASMTPQQLLEAEQRRRLGGR